MKKFLLMTIWASLLSFFGCNSYAEKTNTEPEEGKIEMVDPNDILMSISTIENSLPGTNKLPIDSFNLEILEDDWRQLEFISETYQSEIDQEFDSINQIIEKEAVDLGEGMIAFKNLHVRTLIPTPLNSGIEINELKESFGSIKTGSLSFSQYGRVIDGIYLNTSNFQLYGLTNKSKVVALAFYGLSSWEQLDTFKQEIKALMSKHNLVLVDWRSRKTIDITRIDNYLIPNE